MCSILEVDMVLLVESKNIFKSFLIIRTINDYISSLNGHPGKFSATHFPNFSSKFLP